MNKKTKRQKSILPGATGVRVVKTKGNPNGDIGFALKLFKKELKETGRLQELRERRYFTPKSEKRRVQIQRAKYFQKMESLRDKQ